MEALSVIEDEVVAAAVAPRLGDAEAHVDGAGEEGGFGGFSAALGSSLGYGVDGDDF